MLNVKTYAETVIADAVPFPGRTVVGRGIEDWVPVHAIDCWIKALCLLTSVYTPGNLGRAHPYPNETTPESNPPQVIPPPESP